MICWHCQSEVRDFFCIRCGKIQPFSSGTDDFACMGFERKLNPDIRELEDRFHALSRKFHPDYFQEKSPREREISQENASRLNRAYRTLKDPLSRVESLIRIEREGGEKKDDRPIRAQAPPDLLEEVLELQDKLDEIRQLKNGGEISLLETARADIKRELDLLGSRLAALQASFQALSERWDCLQERLTPEGSPGGEVRTEKEKILEAFGRLLSHRIYIINIISDIKKVLD